jgi:hypothetical protein
MRRSNARDNPLLAAKNPKGLAQILGFCDAIRRGSWPGSHRATGHRFRGKYRRSPCRSPS